MLDYVPLKPETSAQQQPTLRTSRAGRAATSTPGRTRRAAREVAACLSATAAGRGLPTPERTDARRLTGTVGAVDALAAAGRVREAIELARTTLTAGLPTVPAARLRCTLSSLLYSSGRASEAVTEAETLLSDPNLPEDVHQAAETVVLEAVTAFEDTRRTQHRSQDAQAILATRARHGDQLAVAALTNLAHTAWNQGNVTDALDLIQQALRLADTGTSRSPRPHPRLWLAGMLTSLRHFDQAHTQLRIQGENNTLGHTAYTAVHTANLHLAAGRVHHAATDIDTALATADMWGTELFTPWALSILATTALRRGDLTAATRHTHNATRHHATTGHTYGHTASTWAAAQVTAATTGPHHALQQLDNLLNTPHLLRKLLLTEPTAAAWLIRTSLACAAHTHATTVLTQANNLATDNPNQPTLTAAATHANGLLHHNPTTLHHATHTHQDPWARASAAEDLATLLTHQHHHDHAITWYCHAINGYQQSQSPHDATRAHRKLADVGPASLKVVDAEQRPLADAV